MLRTFLSRLFQGPPTMLQPGSPCPSFAALDCDGNRVTEADLAGCRAVLWFYPKADTPG